MLNLVGVRRFPLPLCFRFTLLVLPFWCRLTRVVPDKIQEDRKTVVVVCVCVFQFMSGVVFVSLRRVQSKQTRCTRDAVLTGNRLNRDLLLIRTEAKCHAACVIYTDDNVPHIL